MLPSRSETSTVGVMQAATAGGGTAIKRRLNEKKWNSIHVYIARLIYRKQQEAQESLSAANNGSNTESATAAFLAGAAPKREAPPPPREYTPYPGLHSLPPTPSSPFPRANASFNPALHSPHHSLGLRGLSTLHGLGSRFPPPSIRPSYPGLAAANLYGHPGLESLRHGMPSSELSRLEQERLQQHLASLRSSELLSRTMYENSLRHQQHAAQHREHEMHQALSRDMLLHLEAERRKMLVPPAVAQKPNIPPQHPTPAASMSGNLSELYIRGPQHLQAHLKYGGSGVGASPNSHNQPSFPSIFNRSIDPRARFSHMIQPPKGPE